ncbi:thiol peroxidase [Caminibacter mediatlanticus]|uniref:Thiol peroxidase n=1 Tax=Caminibacter mediatlanticus TB-2 TaxID=391592 RepID=A0AAI9F1E8_9BACT|nr:thiol peroxidase [Caminibacter mediatlanticus]EDM23627.1 putative thiol peroxidase-scavengase p20 oxidoredu [Caminibacter mediatlanticus TB-2]
MPVTTKLKGNEVALYGDQVNVGDNAPVVTLPNSALENVTIGGPSDKAQLIIAVPSLDTPVCAMETTKFNNEAAAVEGATVCVVSMDLPFAAKRFCSTEGIENLQVLSDFKDKAFATNYGVLIAEGPLRGLCARAIFVVGKDGKVTYKELVPEITEEPNYEAALAALKEAASK